MQHHLYRSMAQRMAAVHGCNGVGEGCTKTAVSARDQGCTLHVIPADRQHTCRPVSFSVNAALEYCSIEHLIAAEL